MKYIICFGVLWVVCYSQFMKNTDKKYKNIHNGDISILNINAVDIYKNTIPILKEITVSIRTGQCLHIQGNNGSGKTSLLRCIAGLGIFTSGEITYNNTALTPQELHTISTFIAETPAMHPYHTVLETLALWKAVFKYTYHTEKAIAKIFGLENHMENIIHTLSYGQKKRLDLCRCIIQNRKIWILDEPYSGLDKNAHTTINTLLKNHTNNNGIVILVSHIAPDFKSDNSSLHTFTLQNTLRME